MTTKKHLSVIQSIVGTGLYTEDGQEKKHQKVKNRKLLVGKPLVTVSRYYGTPHHQVAQLLADRLGVQLYDKKLLEAISKEAKDDKHLLERLDERVTSLVDDIVHAFFSKKSTNKDSYFRYMAKVILGIGPAGGVIVGRAAHLLLTERTAFRVRIEGSLKTCARRLIAARKQELDGTTSTHDAGTATAKHKQAVESKNVKRSDVEKEILQANKEWEKFDKDVAGRFPTRVDGYDLVINSDHYTPEQMVRIILFAMQEAGFHVPRESSNSASL